MKTRNIAALLSVAVLAGLFISAPAAGDTAPTFDHTLRVGVLYMDTPTGHRFRKGVEEALAGFQEPGLLQITEDASYPRGREELGVELLNDLVLNEKVDIVLGPTESGVFVRALEKRSVLEAKGVPVISSQVTAEIKHEVSGWFFRANVNVHRRTEAIVDFLNKEYVTVIAVLYADTEFGRRAEAAFANALDGEATKNYMALPYAPPPLRARSQLKAILESRPEAVGIFGEREDIVELHESLEQMNGGVEYRPLLFTVLDARTISDSVPNIYITSVTMPDLNGYDDVKALSHDVTNLVLEELQYIPKNIMGAERRSRLRDRFETLMAGNVGSTAGTYTGMRFVGYENMSKPMVFQIAGGELNATNLLDETIGPFTKAWHKLKRLWDRFGYMPFVNVLLLVLIVLVISTMDLKRWYVGPFKRHMNNRYTLLLFAFNVTISILLFFVLAESGNIQYDSTTTAIIIAFTPSAILRTTIFQTPTGKAIGLGKLYDRFVLWVYERITIGRYLQNQALINLIAYNNSVEGMKSGLREIYQNAPTAEHRARLMARMDETIQGAESWLERRQALARLLMQKLDLDELVACGLAPEGLSNEMVKENRIPEDPEAVVRRAARYCARSPELVEKVKVVTDNLLEGFGDDRRADLLASLQADLEGITTPQAVLRQKLRFLFVLRGYDDEFLMAEGFLPRGHGQSKGTPANDASQATGVSVPLE